MGNDRDLKIDAVYDRLGSPQCRASELAGLVGWALPTIHISIGNAVNLSITLMK